MRFCRFDEGRRGLVEAGRVYDITAATGDELLPAPPADWRSRPARPLAEVRLLSPVRAPGKIVAAPVNYKAHILKAQALGSTMAKWPEKPEIGYRAQSALIGHEETIVKPADYVGRFEAEPELVAVIGRRLRRCTREEALAGIFGWTIGNDVSARAWQYADRTLWRSKNSDTFCPMGPWITTGIDPMQSTTRVRKNGAPVAEFATGDMLFDAADYIVATARYITLHPGDVIWMGSDGNVEMAPGDTIEIEISGIGTLRNRVIEEA